MRPAKRVRQEKPQHLFRGIGALGIGVRTPRTAARPGMTGAMHGPVFGHDPAACFLVDALGVFMAVVAARSFVLGFGNAGAGRHDLLAVGRVNGSVLVAVKDDGRRAQKRQRRFSSR